MPKGKHVNHKGRNRRFTNPEELEEQRKQEEKAKIWRKHSNLPSSDEEDKSDKEEKDSDEASEGSDDDEEGSNKAKGVEGLIAIENPNRIQAKMKKLSAVNEADGGDAPKLTRREKEELERQRAAQHYQKLHAEGKTDEARADLARLAIIRQQREEAAKRREEERKEKEIAKQSKTMDSLKAIKKR